MAHLIEVAFRGNRKEFFRWDGDLPPALKAAIVVEADRGEDLGHVHSTGELAEVRCKGCPHGCGTAPPSRAALRVATLSDQLQATELTRDNESARQRAMERVKVNGLVMKLTDAEWQWDRKKLTFYFTSDKRVDFRTLVRELASMFRTRIELKQIGVRDEAKRLSGIGRCGREYCSSAWLPDLRPVNLAVAKDQKLSLNPSQISGACGRLMCCLRYEHEFYVQSRRRFPKEGKILRTKLGEEKVVTCNIFHETVALRTVEGDTRVVPLAELREELEALGTGLTTDRVTDNEPVYSLMDEASMSDTQEFMVAREAMPMIDILELPIDEGAEAEAEPTASAPELHDAERSGILAGEHATDAVSTSELSAQSIALSSDVVVNIVSTFVSGDPAMPFTATPSGSQPEGDLRRKRRRGRRGGRRLRGAESRNDASDAVANSERAAFDDGDADDNHGPDSDDKTSAE